MKDDSFYIPKSFIYNNGFTIQQKMLFIILKSFSKSENMCHPSKKILAKHMNVSLRTVEKTLKQLEDLGAILIINRKLPNNGKATNLYVLSEIDVETGKFISESLNKYQKLKKEILTIGAV